MVSSIPTVACLILGIPPRDTSEGVIHVTYMIVSFSPLQIITSHKSVVRRWDFYDFNELVSFTKDVQISDTMLVLALDVILSLGFEL